ncbi:hypothetical protein [Mycolicibacterium celeriflavum]|uniref:Uncharacterized protein n=1 Tax=Mycolicibacterium celeriflavum TaxID=1249101 RepID=A0A1X0BZ36_MYCCF|nr:hypothetical protein [Mycolicibacterium celeriflavum]MCV7237622.1 hypothetical protein [Mycolicibacterium celeriflavum]ORA49902.1 hypothetical protein BST21_05015 [Mycolicibacterium celeriflavum]BBY42273.1 hypothetical protein MCEL_05680 [Mycolicibacterium celeriflavum]
MKHLTVAGGLVAAALVTAAPAPADTGEVSCSPCAHTTGGNSYTGQLVEGWTEAPGKMVQGWAEAPGKLVQGWAEAPGKLVQGWAEAPGKLVQGWSEIPSKLGPQSWAGNTDDAGTDEGGEAGSEE